MNIHVDFIFETNVTHEEFLRELIAWVESKGWSCGGKSNIEED